MDKNGEPMLPAMPFEVCAYFTDSSLNIESEGAKK